MKDFLQKLLLFLSVVGQSLFSGLRAIGAAFRRFAVRIRNGVIRFGLKVASVARGIALWVVHFPKNFVAFWKAFGIGVFHFLRDLPAAFRSKDKFCDLLIGVAATVIWCMPVFVVVYVLTWFLNK